MANDPRLFRLCSRLVVGIYGRAPIFGELRSSVGVIRQGDRYLLQHRNDDLGWSFPGGMAWFWETEVQTLHREVFEETGLRVRGERRLLVYSDRRFVPSRITVFAAEAEGELRGSWEGDVEWLPLDAVRAGLFPPHQAIVDWLDRQAAAV